MWIAAAALSLIGSAVLPVGVAGADCTGAGEFGAGSGCPPPGDSSGSGNAESWPPTSVDWPPKLDSDTGSDDKAGSATPIVMPDGQKAPPDVHPESTTSTSTPAKPIVPVGAPSTGTTPTEIVVPAP
jgi:hypothetical protein